MDSEPQEDTNPQLVTSADDSVSQTSSATAPDENDGWSYEESYSKEPTDSDASMPAESSTQTEQSSSENQANASQDTENKKFETELATAQDEIQATVASVTKSLKPKDLGKLVVKLDGQVQRSNTQIISPRLDNLEAQRADDLQLVGLPNDATARQIKVAFNKKMIDLRKLFDATSNKVDSSLQDTLNSLQEAFTRLRENNYQQTSKIVNALENQEKLLIKFEQEASVVRPLTSKEEEKIATLQEKTKDLTTRAKTSNDQALEIKEEFTAFIVDPRVDLALTKTQEIVANLTAANISRSLPELTSSITQTNTALQASSQKVTDATNIFVKLGYTGTFDDLEALKKFYRKNSLELHPDKQAGKTDEEKSENQEKFKELSDAYQILSNLDQIQTLVSAIKHQERLLIEFKNKVQEESIPLTEEQKTTVDTLEQKTISAQELRMLDMQQRFEAGTAESAKNVQEHSAALLVNFQNQIRKITEQTLEPSLTKLPDILNPSYFSFARRSSRVFKQGSIEDIVTSEIQDEIIDPYTTAIKDLYNPETVNAMIPDDQRALNNSYKKALDGYKEKLLKTLETYQKENSSNQKLTSLIKSLEVKLELKTEDLGYASWQKPEQKTSKYDSKTAQQKLTDL